jgi:hypothetical protein
MVTLGCGADRETPAPVAPVVATLEEKIPASAPEFPDGTQSLRLTRTIAVRLAPGDKAKQIGTIAEDTRVAWTQLATAPGCKKAWVEIAPRGWVCGEYLAPLTRPPSGVELPRVAAGDVVPGVFGKVVTAGALSYTLGARKPDKKAGKAASRPAGKATNHGLDAGTAAPVQSPQEVEPEIPAVTADGRVMVAGPPLVGSINVRKYGEITIGGKVYWKVHAKADEYVLQSAISPHRPSWLQGVRLGDETGLSLPLGFVFPGAPTAVFSRSAARGGGAVRKLEARAAVPILGRELDDRGQVVAYRIGEGEWVAAAALRVVEAAPPPARIVDGERWIDIDLDRQVLVAYEGTLPVYVTLVSTGTKETPTETGVFRMWKKMSEADMRDLQAEDPYSVATVPWTQFFFPEEDLAIHTAYWHDKFGVARSHGCVNVAPRDARWLYFWSDPWVPPGWTMTAGVVEAPGSIVRVRSAADPDPPVRGYAQRVDELRAQRKLAPAP